MKYQIILLNLAKYSDHGTFIIQIYRLSSTKGLKIAKKSPPFYLLVILNNILVIRSVFDKMLVRLKTAKTDQTVPSGAVRKII